VPNVLQAELQYLQADFVVPPMDLLE